MGTSKAPLNPKQTAFAQEYLVDLNATQAAIRAGYAARSAAVTGARLLINAKVAAAITRLQAERAERVSVKADEVLEELALLGRSDVRHYMVGENGELALAPGAPDHAMRAVSSIKHRVRTKYFGEAKLVEHIVEFRLWDKPAALRMAGQHLGLYKEIHEHHNKTLEDLLREVEPGG